jgi:hypothetical protein
MESRIRNWSDISMIPIHNTAGNIRVCLFHTYGIVETGK